MQLIFEQIRAGGDRNFGYLLGDRDTREGVLIDPSYSPETFVQRSRDQGLTVTHVINTHGHPDHTNGNAKAAELTVAPVAAFADSYQIGVRWRRVVHERMRIHASVHLRNWVSGSSASSARCGVRESGS